MDRPKPPDVRVVEALSALEAATLRAFEGVYQRSFRGDVAANPRLRVEVLSGQVVEHFPTFVLVAPWTLNGIVLPPLEPAVDGTGADARARWDTGFPEELVVAAQRRAVFVGELPELGHYRSVNLVPDVSRLTKPEQARTLAASFAGPFHDALREGLSPAE